MQRIAIGVLSCEKYADRRKAVDETWGKDAREQAATFFYVIGDPSLKEPQWFEKESIFRVPVEDDYAHLPGKVWWMCKLVNMVEFDYLFKCDDDTFVVPDRLVNTHWEGDFIGTGHRTYRRRLSGGAGYLLSRRAVEFLVTAMEGIKTGDEDLLVFDALISEDIRPIKCDRFKRLTRLVDPAPDNNLITTHFCSPEDMMRIYREFANAK